jgi:hypothetical protein
MMIMIPMGMKFNINKMHLQSPAMQPLLEIEDDQANLAGLENNGKHRQSWMDLPIQDDSSTEDEWSLNLNFKPS